MSDQPTGGERGSVRCACASRGAERKAMRADRRARRRARGVGAAVPTTRRARPRAATFRAASSPHGASLKS